MRLKLLPFSAASAYRARWHACLRNTLILDCLSSAYAKRAHGTRIHTSSAWQAWQGTSWAFKSHFKSLGFPENGKDVGTLQVVGLGTASRTLLPSSFLCAKTGKGARKRQPHRPHRPRRRGEKAKTEPRSKVKVSSWDLAEKDSLWKVLRAFRADLIMRPFGWVPMLRCFAASLADASSLATLLLHCLARWNERSNVDRVWFSEPSENRKVSMPSFEWDRPFRSFKLLVGGWNASGGQGRSEDSVWTSAEEGLLCPRTWFMTQRLSSTSWDRVTISRSFQSRSDHAALWMSAHASLLRCSARGCQLACNTSTSLSRKMKWKEQYGQGVIFWAFRKQEGLYAFFRVRQAFSQFQAFGWWLKCIRWSRPLRRFCLDKCGGRFVMSTHMVYDSAAQFNFMRSSYQLQ